MCFKLRNCESVCSSLLEEPNVEKEIKLVENKMCDIIILLGRKNCMQDACLNVVFAVSCKLFVEFCAGFSIDLNFQDVMTSKLKNLDVSVQNLEVMQ